MTRTSPDIIVIGAGIIGASIAWHLAKAGANVAICARKKGGVATANSFAWINANWGNPEPYYRLRHHSMQGWKRLAGLIEDLKPDWCGSLCYDLEPDALTRFAEEHGIWGYGFDRIERDEILRLEPHLARLPDWALWIAEEGMVEPVAAAEALLKDALRLGATLLSADEVLGLERQGPRITGIRTADGLMEAQEIVLAAGTETVALARDIGVTIPVSASPGLLIETKPLDPVLNHIVVAPDLEMRQSADGRIIAATSYNGTDPGADPDATAAAVFERLKSHLDPDLALHFGGYRIGYRPLPEDGFPIIGRVEAIDGLYVAVTHSGITLAPAIGECAAAEILDKETMPLIDRYRLSRFD